jgi:23S rRNA (uridine2552-2'-O)-methyltransferase
MKYRSRSAFKLIQLHNQWGRFLEPPDVKYVVDLGAAPGGWSQVVSWKLGWHRDDNSHKNKRGTRRDEMGTRAKSPRRQDTKDPMDSQCWSDCLDDPTISHSHLVGRGKIIAVDLLPIEPIHGVNALQADFLSDEASAAIRALLALEDNPEGKVDVILSDMAANISGIGTRDSQSSLDVCNAVLRFTSQNLRRARDIGRSEGGVLV